MFPYTCLSLSIVLSFDNLWIFQISRPLRCRLVGGATEITAGNEDLARASDLTGAAAYCNVIEQAGKTIIRFDDLYLQHSENILINLLLCRYWRPNMLCFIAEKSNSSKR
jgi:hypothetical protein